MYTLFVLLRSLPETCPILAIGEPPVAPQHTTENMLAELWRREPDCEECSARKACLGPIEVDREGESSAFMQAEVTCIVLHL